MQLQEKQLSDFSPIHVELCRFSDGSKLNSSPRCCQFRPRSRRPSRSAYRAFFADALNLSANYFGDLVKAQTGSSPQQLIQQNISAQARHHLTTTTDTVSQIAYALGFEYPQYFSRLFKKQTGQTPQEFRAQA